MSDPLPTSSHVRVRVYEPRARIDGYRERAEHAPALDLTTRAAFIPKHGASVAFVLAMAGGGLWGAMRGDGLAEWLGILWTVTFALFAAELSRRLFLPWRIRIEGGSLRVGLRRYPLSRLSEFRIMSPEVFPDRHNVVATLDDGSSPYDWPRVTIALQLPLDDARAVLTMVRRVLGHADERASP